MHSSCPPWSFSSTLALAPSTLRSPWDADWQSQLSLQGLWPCGSPSKIPVSQWRWFQRISWGISWHCSPEVFHAYGWRWWKGCCCFRGALRPAGGRSSTERSHGLSCHELRKKGSQDPCSIPELLEFNFEEMKVRVWDHNQSGKSIGTSKTLPAKLEVANLLVDQC